jgi:hypothetical protein
MLLLRNYIAFICDLENTESPENFLLFQAEEVAAFFDQAFPGKRIKYLEITDEIYDSVEEAVKYVETVPEMNSQFQMMMRAIFHSLEEGMCPLNFDSSLKTMAATLEMSYKYQIPLNYTQEEIDKLLQKAEAEIKTNTDEYKGRILDYLILDLKSKREILDSFSDEL